jgi:hypothetical protein
MYHPRAASPDELSLGFTDEDFEFIEIKNTALADLDLTSVGFTSGVNFEFSPGTRLAAGSYGLVVKNQAAFEKRYGKGINILGNYGDGNLKNAGELVTLSYGSNTPIRSVFYRDGAPWPSEADGTGRSLELIMPHSRPDHSIPENWRPSNAALGTPGGDDGLTFAAWGAAHGGVTDPLGDPDGDGLNNVLEYAFLGDPLSASSADEPKAEVQELEVDGQKSLYFTLSFRGRTDASDLGYHIQQSSDLAQWKEDGSWVSRQPVGDGTARYLWRASKPLSIAPRVFVRVHVTW